MSASNYRPIVLFQRRVKMCELIMEKRTKYTDLKGYHKATEKISFVS